MKPFWKSRQFWAYVSSIVISTGALFVGDITLEKLIPALVIDVLGILGIIFRWNSNGESLGWKK